MPTHNCDERTYLYLIISEGVSVAAVPAIISMFTTHITGVEIFLFI